MSCEKINLLPNQEECYQHFSGRERKEMHCVVDLGPPRGPAGDLQSGFKIEREVEELPMSSTIHVAILFWARPGMITQSRQSIYLR